MFKLGTEKESTSILFKFCLDLLMGLPYKMELCLSKQSNIANKYARLAKRIAFRSTEKQF